MQPRDQLTHKEIPAATLVWDGLTNREIANIIGTSEQVVKNYLRTTLDKLGVWSRLELALYVAGHGGGRWVSELLLPDRLESKRGPGGTWPDIQEACCRKPEPSSSQPSPQSNGGCSFTARFADSENGPLRDGGWTAYAETA